MSQRKTQGITEAPQPELLAKLLTKSSFLKNNKKIVSEVEICQFSKVTPEAVVKLKN